MGDSIIFQSAIALGAIEASVTLETSSVDYKCTYVGYARSGTKGLDEHKFGIKRYLLDLKTDITTIMWANGTRERIFAFSECETLNYEFLR